MRGGGYEGARAGGRTNRVQVHWEGKKADVLLCKAIVLFLLRCFFHSESKVSEGSHPSATLPSAVVSSLAYAVGMRPLRGCAVTYEPCTSSTNFL